MDYPDPILVFGVGRCGSSAVAGLLQIAGVFMGRELTKPRMGNPKGYFEDIAFVQAHRGRIRVDDEPGWKDVHVGTPEWKEGVDKILKNRRALGIPWGFKDPAVCYHLHYWLKDYFINPKMIWTVRNLFDCQKSLMIYGQLRHPDYIPDEEVHDILSRQYMKGREEQYEKFVKGRDVLIVSFQDLIFDRTEEVIDEVLDYAELKVNKTTRRKMSQFIEYPDRTEDYAYLKSLEEKREASS